MRSVGDLGKELEVMTMDEALEASLVVGKEDEEKVTQSVECGTRVLSLDTGDTDSGPQFHLTTTDNAGAPTQLNGWSLHVKDYVQNLHLLSCTPNQNAELLLTTRSGTTRALSIDFTTFKSTQRWRAEEALGSIASALFLDVTHAPEGEECHEEQDTILKSLSFTSRLKNQGHDLTSFLAGGFMERARTLITKDDPGEDEHASSTRTAPTAKDYSFGLTKVAVALSTRHLAKLIGVDTASSGGDRVLWSIALNRNAAWHRMVHGATTGRSSVFGHGMHHPHSHEILILSHPDLDDDATDGQLVWRCVDGVKGTVLSTGTQDIVSPVVQILPVHAHSLSSHGEGGGCRQNAALVHANGSVSAVPRTETGEREVKRAVRAGLYAHYVEDGRGLKGGGSGEGGVPTGLFRSMKIVADDDNEEVGTVMTIGETVFDPRTETILSVTYPQRNEVVQSPTTIVGDDSLLLKYLNPHLCVVVTEATPQYIVEAAKGDAGDTEEATDGERFYKALSGSGSGTTPAAARTPKKPIGATQPTEEMVTTTTPTTPTTPSAPIPTLFINLVDTVSGQIVYRVSHSHTTPPTPSSPTPNHASTNVPVVLSENWIVYAFPNHRTRRTELGVLTLHEGMIDKFGITAFSSPTQSLTFSSVSGGPKPIVLTKTFGIARPVSALGVTNTRGGISSKSVLLATGVNGQIVRVDRRLLDPRRPAGVPKLTEKKEGLLQYSPLIPISPILTPSYSNNIAHVTSIISTAANLESQTLFLAYGGPDIFFTRFAPSKGFDSLPANFNKLLLVLVLLALFVGLMKAKSMTGRKAVKFGWS